MSFGPFRLTPSARLLERDGVPLNIGARALDILILLADRPGEIIGKKVLLDRVWPDVIVDEGSLRFHVSGLRKALGDGEGGARYIGTAAGRGYCFLAPVERHAQDTSARTGPVERQRGPAALLPAPLARMLGRDGTIDDLSELLLEHRFLSITGPGGIGKTTVATAIGHGLLQAFDGAVRFVDLASITDPKLVPTIVASAVGSVAHAADPAPNLIPFLQDRRLLLILDSCEHVIDGVAPLAERIFAEADGVHLLATTREALRVEGEHIHRLLPLETPPEGLAVDSEAALAFSAVQLFVQRVAASGLRYELTDADAPVVADICRSLDGIPLALELAAGGVNAYGVRGIADLLGDQFDRVAHGRRTSVRRHQTLGATLDWSYRLLTEDERVLLRRLSVFVGYFDVEAAEAVAAFEPIDGSATLDALGNLVAKSLISVDLEGSSARYRLLDTTRTYALERLKEAGEAAELARRHALHSLKILEDKMGNPSHSHGKGSPLREQMGNVRAALAWCFGENGDEAIGTALTAAAAPLLVELSLLSECYRWTHRAVGALDEETRGTRREINLQAALGHSLMFTEGDSERVRRAFARGLELARDLGEPLMELRLLASMHLFNKRIGNYRAAVAFAEQSNEVAKNLGHVAALRAAHAFVGLSQHIVGNHVAARPLLEASIADVGSAPHEKTIHLGFDFANRSSIALARVLWLLGEADRAAELADRTIDDAARLEHPVTLCIALIWGITVSLWAGDRDGSEAKIARFAAHARKHSLNPYNAVALGYKGEACLLQGDGELAASYLRQALETLHAARYELVTSTFMISLAHALSLAGRSSEALQKIDEAIALIQENGDVLYMPEALRIKGVILSGSENPDPTAAEACFDDSLAWAKRQSALAWELRTATTLAANRARHGKRREAEDVLAPVYRRFTQGFETADLKAARAVLEGLGSNSAASTLR